MKVRVEHQQVKPPPPTFVIELTRTEARTLEMVLNTVDKRVSSLAQQLRNDLSQLIKATDTSFESKLGPDGY